MDAEVREKIHLEILKRTGAYHANDHVLLPSGQHTSEYIEKTLVTTEASFTEGLGAVIAKHFAQWPIDVVLSTGPGALILSHCVARAHPVPADPGLRDQGRQRGQAPGHPAGRVPPPDPPGHEGADRRGSGQLGHDGAAAHPARRGPGRRRSIGIGALWRRTKQAEIDGKEIFSLVSRDFPTYPPETCPLCEKGVALNQEFVKRREHRKPSHALEKDLSRPPRSGHLGPQDVGAAAPDPPACCIFFLTPFRPSPRFRTDQLHRGTRGATRGG